MCHTRKQTLLVLGQKNSGTNLKEACPVGQKEGIGNMKNFKLGLKQIKHIVSKFIMRVKNQNGTPHL